MFGFYGQVRVDAGVGGRAMAQPLLNPPQVDAGFEQMRGPTLAQRMHGSAFVVAALLASKLQTLNHSLSQFGHGYTSRLKLDLSSESVGLRNLRLRDDRVTKNRRHATPWNLITRNPGIRCFIGARAWSP